MPIVDEDPTGDSAINSEDPKPIIPVKLVTKVSSRSSVSGSS